MKSTINDKVLTSYLYCCPQQGNEFFLSRNLHLSHLRLLLTFMSIIPPGGRGNGPPFAPQHFNIYFIDPSILPWGNAGKTSHFVRSSQTACWRFYLEKPVLPEANSPRILDCHSQATEMSIKIECVHY